MKKVFVTISKGILILSLFTFAVTSDHKLSTDIHVSAAKQPTQEVILTDVDKHDLHSAVRDVIPSVVTIEVSKKVPVFDISYERPFNDAREINIPVYKLQGMTEQKVGAGSGFIISKDGYIATNKHVVMDRDATYTIVEADGTIHDATVVYIDQTYDVAIVKVDGTFDATAKLGSSENLMLGQPVAAIGNAYGEKNNAVTQGSVSAFNKDIVAQGDDVVENLSGLIETTTSIVPGYSGGPLVDAKGNIVGINVATDATRAHSSFSIPIDTVKDILENYTN